MGATVTRMFSDTHVGKVDPKGRVSIPSAFRRIIDASDPNINPNQEKARGNFWVASGLAKTGRLEGFTVESLAEVHADMRAMSPDSKEYRAARFLYLNNVREMQCDENGRIVLDAGWRALMGLGEDVTFVGSGRRFEIWNTATYAEQIARREAELAEFGDDLDTDALFASARGGA